MEFYELESYVLDMGARTLFLHAFLEDDTKLGFDHYLPYTVVFLVILFPRRGLLCQ